MPEHIYTYLYIKVYLLGVRQIPYWRAPQYCLGSVGLSPSKRVSISSLVEPWDNVPIAVHLVTSISFYPTKLGLDPIPIIFNPSLFTLRLDFVV